MPPVCGTVFGQTQFWCLQKRRGHICVNCDTYADVPVSEHKPARNTAVHKTFTSVINCDHYLIGHLQQSNLFNVQLFVFLKYISAPYICKYSTNM